MTGWIKGGPYGQRWHQCEYDSRTGIATLLCSSRQITVTDETPVMDYRWRPHWTEHCYHPQCRQEVSS